MRSIPVGSTVHCVEFKPGKGAQIARSAGTSVQLVAREGNHATLRLRSGELRRVLIDCRATIGEVGQPGALATLTGQSRCHAVAWHQTDGSWCRHEPGRSPSWGW